MDLSEHVHFYVRGWKCLMDVTTTSWDTCSMACSSCRAQRAVLRGWILIWSMTLLSLKSWASWLSETGLTGLVRQLASLESCIVVVSENFSLIYFYSKWASIGITCSFKIKASTFGLKDWVSRQIAWAFRFKHFLSSSERLPQVIFGGQMLESTILNK
jgi:hypothetical protein